MSKDNLIDTDERDAISERTPGVADSSERIRELARKEARPIAREAVAAHSTHCEHEGPLCSVAKQVDKLRTSNNRQGGALAILTVLGPIVLGIWLSRNADERLRIQIEVARDVAQQLKAVQEAAKGGHTRLQSSEPARTMIATSNSKE
jgi:hypothetical protein